MKKIFTTALAIVALSLQIQAQQSPTSKKASSTAKTQTNKNTTKESTTAPGAKVASDDNKSNVGAAIQFTQTRHNFGTIKQNVPVITKFVFENTGTQNLIIKKATAGCGCTTPKWPVEPIAPGQKAEIEVGYDAKSEGNFIKIITVETNAGDHKLTISGVVEVPASDNSGSEIKLPIKK
jgi:hypothetical protein